MTEPHELSDDDLALLRHLAQGLRTGQIAALTHRSPRAVSRQLRLIRDRLGVERPIQAVVWAVRHGYL